MRTTKRSAVAIAVALWAGSALVPAAVPPNRIHYQGVLRNASEAPLDGDFDMVFRLWDAAAAGNEILVDRHLLVDANEVTVTGGLFNADIGAGQILDGSGPGVYTDVAAAFRDYGDVWLEIQVGAETLSPRTPVVSAPYALNAAHLDGMPASRFLDVSSTAQIKEGTLLVGQSSGLTETLGIEAYGPDGGGFFKDQNASGYAYAGYGNYGAVGYGNEAGGYFSELDTASYGAVGSDGYGVRANGPSAGGHFQDSDGSGEAYVAVGNIGIQAYGNLMGGYFTDLDASGLAHVGTGDRGIWAKGTFAGGTFSHPDNVTHWADVSTPTQKILGTGAVSFVQNHPYEKDKVVVYAAPEGDEVAVYTRGSARLVDGVARVALGETFAWVANPDIGLTAHLTPRSRVELYVESVSTTELVVRALDGPSDASFDYIVYGLRIGFEEVAPVRMKGREAFLPARSEVEELYAGRSELRRYSAMERFKEMRTALGETAALNLSKSQAMAAAIDGNRDAILAQARADAEVERSSQASVPLDGPAEPLEAPAIRQAPAPTVAREAVPIPVVEGLLSIVTVWEDVRPGDVLVIDPAQPGSLRRADTPLDRGVAGCVAETPEGTALATGQALVATSGVVLCLADASFGPIAPGDLLTTSTNPGHAARADDADQGAILGKAMEALPGGTGLIRVLMR